MNAVELTSAITESLSTSRISTEMTRSKVNTLWITLNQDPKGGPQNFTPALLAEFHAMMQTLKASAGHWSHDGQQLPFHYAVMQSNHPEYFSLGGDLSHFRTCINERNKAALYGYSKRCLELLHDWSTLLKDTVTSITLVQGRALGGGFEIALSTDFLIAEEQSTFGFPEIMFGLFPCTGGMGLLARRVGVHQAERMMTNKRIYSAPELLEMGVIDEICPTGRGQQAVDQFIATHASRRKARMMLQRSRHRLAPLDYQECAQVVDEWVETALQLSAEELRAMDMLIMLQQGQQAEPRRLAA